MSAGAPSRAGGAIPIAGICCLGLLAFLVASTIVLALIPLYIPRKTVTVTNTADDDTFQLQYSAGGLDRANTASGTVDNLDAVHSALNLGSGASLSGGNAKATYASATTRRRRNLLIRRRRAVACTMEFNFKGTFTAKSGCTGGCATKSKNEMKQKITETRSPRLPISVKYAGRSLAFDGLGCSFSGLQEVVQVPKGFGAVDSLEFSATKSGDITEPDTWANGVVPFNGCGVTVQAGVTLILSGTTLLIPIKSLIVATGASLTVGSSGKAGFSFEFALAISIFGAFSFQGSGGALVLPFGTSLVFGESAVYTGAALVIQALSESGQLIVISSLTPGEKPISVSISTDGTVSGGSTTSAPTTAVAGETAAAGETTTAAAGVTTTTAAGVTTTTAAGVTTTTAAGETTTAATTEEVTGVIV